MTTRLPPRRAAAILGALGVSALAGCDIATAVTQGRPLSLARPRTAVTRPTVESLTDTGVLTPGPRALSRRSDDTSTTVDAGCRVIWDQARAQEDVTVDGVVARTAGSTNNGVTSTAAHATGRRYFEVVFEGLGDLAFNSVVVIADDPVDVPDASWFTEVGCQDGIGHCASITSFSAGDVVSVMADLDTGRVDFAVNGSLTVSNGFFEPRALAIVPGAGPFRAGVTLAEGATARANFGAEPFAYAPPEGFTSWSAGLEANDAGDCRSAPRSVAPPAPVSAASDCDAGYSLTSIATGVVADTGTELIVLGSHDPTGGVVDVRIDRPGRSVLVLGGYNETTWNVVAGEGAIIEKIIARGYERTAVNGPAGVPTEVLSYEAGTGADYVAGHAWPYSFGGSDTVGFVGDAEQRTGLPLTIFAGTYDTSSFTVHADGTPTRTCR